MVGCRLFNVLASESEAKWALISICGSIDGEFSSIGSRWGFRLSHALLLVTASCQLFQLDGDGRRAEQSSWEEIKGELMKKQLRLTLDTLKLWRVNHVQRINQQSGGFSHWFAIKKESELIRPSAGLSLDASRSRTRSDYCPAALCNIPHYVSADSVCLST